MNDLALTLDQPEVQAAVADAFARYEAALRAHDVAALNDFFLDSRATTRFGVTEHAHGIAAVRTYRQRAGPLPAGRELQRTVVTAIGTLAASVSTEFTYPDSPQDRPPDTDLGAHRGGLENPCRPRQ